jgi:hypothetical protein
MLRETASPPDDPGSQDQPHRRKDSCLPKSSWVLASESFQNDLSFPTNDGRIPDKSTTWLKNRQYPVLSITLTVVVDGK